MLVVSIEQHIIGQCELFLIGVIDVLERGTSLNSGWPPFFVYTL